MPAVHVRLIEPAAAPFAVVMPVAAVGAVVSTLTVWVALDATLRTTKRELPIAELYRLPTDDDREVTTLARDELILEIDVMPPDASTYLKAMDRRKWAFPIVGVAAARFGSEIRIALAGVAPIPWLLDSTAALENATPLPGTAYKVEIARALIRRAYEAL